MRRVVDAANVVDGPKAKLKAPIVAQFVKFGIVGISNTLLTLVVYTVLLKVFGVWYLAASAIGFVAGPPMASCGTAGGRSASTSATR